MSTTIMQRVLPLLSLLLFFKTAAAYSYLITRSSTALAMSSNSETLLEEIIPTAIDTNCSLDPLLNDGSNDDVLNPQQLNGLESSMIGFEAVTKSDRAWLKKYNLLVNYYTKHHHTMIPVADATLGRWVQRQRSYHKQGILAESRVKALNEVKFVFDARNHNKKESPTKKWKKKSWDERYDELKLFFDSHGDCNVPLKNGSLGGWVQYQRQCYDKGKLSTYQVDKLKEINFIWNVKNYQWDQRFLELKAFIEEHGHSCIPSTFTYKSLQSWCGSQRKLRQMKQADATIQCALTDEREERLDSINFDWQTSHDYMWKQRLQQLKEFKEENGHVKLNKSNGQLGSWVETQRTEYRFKMEGQHTHLTDERINELESIGFVWSIRDAERDESIAT